MARTWSSALTVIPVIGNLKIEYNMCPFADPATSPSFQPEGVRNADLVIYVTANSDFCSQSSTKVLASAFSCFWDQYERPIAGTIGEDNMYAILIYFFGVYQLQGHNRFYILQ